MICSMTGYAACTRHVDGGTLQLEIKSVNSRYLDFHFRVGEELRASEIPLRELFPAISSGARSNVDSPSRRRHSAAKPCS